MLCFSGTFHPELGDLLVGPRYATDTCETLRLAAPARGKDFLS